MSRLRSGEVPSRWTSMNRGSLMCGLAAATAGLNRSLWPTASTTPARLAAAISVSASVTVCVTGFSTSVCTPDSINGRAIAA